MKDFIIFCLLILTLIVTGYCGEPSKIELKDGSVINGEVSSLTDGVYTINTVALGAIKLAAEKISKIESASAPVSAPAGSVSQAQDPLRSQVSTYSDKLMKNPENAAIVKNLASNPNIQAMASDPQIQAAAKKGDIKALMNNPKFMVLVDSPEMQEAVKEIKK